MAHVPVAEAAPIEIQTLGGFSVLREGEAIASGEWQSRKARDLVKILVARRGRSTPREMLMEALWPDEDPARLSNRLSVALSTARAVFDPDKRHPADHYIAADGESARLVMPSLTLDVDRFLRRAAVGLRLLGQGQDADALPHLGAAEAEYSGDFLEEDAYVDWATPLREEARAAYLAVTRASPRRPEEPAIWTRPSATTSGSWSEIHTTRMPISASSVRLPRPAGTGRRDDTTGPTEGSCER